MFLMTYLVSRDSHRHPTLLAHSPTDTDYILSPVGPVVAHSHPVDLNTRYTTEHFEVPRPQVVNRTVNTTIARALLEGKLVQSDRSLQEILSPLPAIQQRPGHKIGFFEQGIITGGLITLTSLITIVSAAGYWALRMR